MAMESRMAGPCSSHSSRQVPPTQRQRQALPRGGRKFFLSKREGCPSKFRIHSQRQDGEDWDSNSHESSEDGFMEIEEEFRRIVQRNFDGLELQSREAEMDLSEMELSSEDDVTFWLEVDKPEEPKVEAQELFDWWNDLDQVYVLIFQLNDGEEDGIFTLKDSSEEENNNFILSFESQVEAARYGSKLQANLQGMEAEIELMGRDELLQLCKELEVGVRIIKEGGQEPDIPEYVQREKCSSEGEPSSSFEESCEVESLDEIRRALENLLPDEDLEDYFE